MDTSLLNQPYHWLKQIPGDLWQQDESPLLGYSPPFPWNDMAAYISKTLELGSLEVQPGEWQWRPQEELLAGLGNKLKSIPLNIAPLAGSLYWVMPEHEAKRLVNLLMMRHASFPLEHIDEAFYIATERFLAIEALSAWEKVYLNGTFSPAMLDGDELPSEHCLCLDVTIKHGQENIHGRLFLSKTFRKSWMQHFAEGPANFLSESPNAERFETLVQLEAGKVHLSPAEWKNIHVGDLVLLDSCSLDPDEDKGRIMLVINGIPFFRAKIKQGSVKILEHPLYHEVDVTMTPPPHENNDEEEELFSDIEDDFSTDDFSDDDFSEELSEEESEFTEEHLSEEHPAPAPKKAPKQIAEEEKETTSSVAAPSKAITALEDVPLSIIVEVGRVQLSIKKLLELQPGNMLDLNIHPDAGVDLVLNGKRVAKGELLRIGDALGVRIVELS